MTTTLWRSSGAALVESDGVVNWSGPAADAGSGADRTMELDGALLPAFADGHIHVTQTGLLLDGLDLHSATSKEDVLDRLAAYARSNPGDIVLGTGWDETRWPVQTLPTAAELDRATAGGLAYLSRVDVHSAIASSALLDAAGNPRHDAGRVTLDDHHAVRRAALRTLRPAQIGAAQERCLSHAAGLGIAELHEMAGPEVSGVADALSLREVAQALGTNVEVWWSALGDIDTVRENGLTGAGGDLFCDGSIGSRTAALHEPYDDAPDTSGVLRFDTEEIVEHILAAWRAGLPTGFHVIGDAAVDQVLDALEAAATALPLVAGTRLEHVEMASRGAIARLAGLGVTASVQPAFDAAWGGPTGMYATRLGRERGTSLNPFADFAAAGVPLRFGSDSPVCAVDPWGGVRAAVHHRTPGQGLDVAAAFDAHTVRLRPGAPATFAVWSHDGRTDLGSAPTCLRTVVGGRTVFSAEGVRT